MPAKEDWENFIAKYGVEEVWNYVHAIVTLRSLGYQLWDKKMGPLTAIRYAMAEMLNGHCTHPGVPDIEHDEEILGVSCNICMVTWAPTKPRRAPRDAGAQLTPPLLRQMVTLAETGMTVLPPVRHPDLDKSFPEMDVCMGELQWGPNTRCLIGGDKFEVMNLPPDSHGIYKRYKLFVRPYWYVASEEAAYPIMPELEIYQAETLWVGYRPSGSLSFESKVRWEGRFMVLVGSSVQHRFREW